MERCAGQAQGIPPEFLSGPAHGASIEPLGVHEGQGCGQNELPASRFFLPVPVTGTGFSSGDMVLRSPGCGQATLPEIVSILANCLVYA